MSKLLIIYLSYRMTWLSIQYQGTVSMKIQFDPNDTSKLKLILTIDLIRRYFFKYKTYIN